MHVVVSQVEHLDPQHLNEALCSSAVQGCPRVVARFANVALFHASHIELDFPPRWALRDVHPASLAAPAVLLCQGSQLSQRLCARSCLQGDTRVHLVHLAPGRQADRRQGAQQRLCDPGLRREVVSVAASALVRQRPKFVGMLVLAIEGIGRSNNRGFRCRCLVATGDGAGKDGQLAVFLSVAGEPAEAWRERVSFTIRLVNQTAPMRSIERGAFLSGSKQRRPLLPAKAALPAACLLPSVCNM